MNEWIKVVTHPLGLAGFALFLVFGYLAKAKKQDKQRWLTPVAIAMAAVVLIGGLALAYKQVSTPSGASTQTNQPPAAAKQQANQQVQQTTSGKGSPAVQGVQGDVTITVDQSSDKTETDKPAVKKPAEKISKQ